QYTVAPIGWKDSAEWLAYQLSTVFDDKNFEGNADLGKFFGIFHDDATLGTNDIITHIKMLARMFRCVARHTATISDKKSFWFVRRCIQMGYIVGQGEMVPEEKKVDAVRNWPAPKNQTELKRFIC